MLQEKHASCHSAGAIQKQSEERLPSVTSMADSSSPSPALSLPEEGHLETHHAIGPWQAALALFKCVVGPSILFLPAGIKNAGLISAITISVVVGAAATWCLLLVLDTARYLRQHGKIINSFGDVGEVAFGCFGRVAVEAAIVISQLGFCTAYCVFVAENLQAIIFEVSGGIPRPADEEIHDGERLCRLPWILGDERLVYYIIVAVMPIMAPFTWIRQLRYFACTNMVASTLVVSAVFYMFCSFAAQLVERHFTAAPGIVLFETRGTLVYLGTAAFAFEGIGVLLPLERSMADPRKLDRVVCWTMSSACLLQVIFGGTAYFVYGAATTSIVTISLGRGGMLGGMVAVELVQLAWVLEVLLTLPLQLFPAVHILEPRLLPRSLFRRRRSGLKWRKNVVRCGLLLLCMLVATAGYSSVDNLVALIGALGCVPLALVFPPLFHRGLVSSCNDAADAGIQPAPPLPSGGQAGLLEHQQPHLPDGTSRVEVSGPNGIEASGPKGIGGATSDAILAGSGLLAVIVATVVAVVSWINDDFHLQECVLLT